MEELLKQEIEYLKKLLEIKDKQIKALQTTKIENASATSCWYESKLSSNTTGIITPITTSSHFNCACRGSLIKCK